MTWGVDDYPGSAAPERGGYDRWGYSWRNCTSFAMHRIVDDLHLGPFFWGDGGDFGARARAQGFPVDGGPRVHDCFSLAPGTDGAGPAGHTGMVLEVDTGSGRFLAEDYNWVSLAYHQHWLPIPGAEFIHLAASATPPLSERTEMLRVLTPNDGVWLLSGNLYVHVDDPQTDKGLVAAGVPNWTVDEAMHQTLKAAAGNHP